MKQPKYKGKELLPLSVIDAARDGDAQAVDSVLRYYEGYINKLCTRTLYDPDGQPRVRVDEYMKRRLEIKLIHSSGRYRHLYDPRLRQPSGHSQTQTEYIRHHRCSAAESRSGCFLIRDNKNTAGDRPEWSVSGNRTVRSYS